MIWTLQKADNEFSKFIRNRDGRCMRPGCRNPHRQINELTCSHYFKREIMATRFDPDNCIAICPECHYYILEKNKNGQYLDMMIRRLGKERMIKLTAKALRPAEASAKRKEIIKLMKILNK